MKKTSNFLLGWNEERVQRALQHYDSLTDRRQELSESPPFV